MEFALVFVDRATRVVRVAGGAFVSGTRYVVVEGRRRIRSEHRTIASAVRAADRAQRACREANGPNTWLDLLIRRDDGSCCGAPLSAAEVRKLNEW